MKREDSSVPKANLIPKKNSVICEVAKPRSESKSVFREVRGAFMEHASQENYASWREIFHEIARECPDWLRRERLRKRNR